MPHKHESTLDPLFPGPREDLGGLTAKNAAPVEDMSVEDLILKLKTSGITEAQLREKYKAA